MREIDQTILDSKEKQKRLVFEDLTSKNNLNVPLIHFRCAAARANIRTQLFNVKCIEVYQRILFVIRTRIWVSFFFNILHLDYFYFKTK